MDAGVAFELEIDDGAQLIAEALEPAGDLLRLDAGAPQLAPAELGVKERIADNERANPALTPPRDAPGESGFHEDLASDSEAFAQPLAAMVQELPRVAHELA